MRHIPAPPLAGFAAALLAAASPAFATQWSYGPTVPTAGNAPRSLGTLVHAPAGMFLVGGLPENIDGDSPVHKLVNDAWTNTTPVEGVFLRGGHAVDETGRILVIAGTDDTGDPGDHYVWDEANGGAGGIDERSSAAPAEGFAIATDDLGRVYSIGGSNEASTGLADPGGNVERYDATTNQWTVLPSLPAPVMDAAACYDGQGHILVIGGYDVTGTRVAGVSTFDLSLGTWTQSPVVNMPSARAGCEAVLGNDGLVYVLGGSTDAGATSDVLILDPATGAFGAGPSMLEPREHFGCTVDSAGFIWAVGGDASTTSEKLFTSTCPTIVAVEAAQAFTGTIASARVVLGGSPPFTYTWRADGLAMMDGTTAGGSLVSGTQTGTLTFRYVASAESAFVYDCVVSNACGSVTTPPVTLTIIDPPALPDTFTFESLHPPGAPSSAANSVDGSTIVGQVSFVHPQYGVQGRPSAWHDLGAGTRVDLTPAGSVGGSCTMIRGGMTVGWWWWPYTVPQQGTGYHQNAAVWDSSGQHHQMQISGWEFGSIRATDGQVHVGTCRRNETSTTVTGFRWTGTNRGGRGLTPSIAWGTSATAVDGGKIYGNANLGFGVSHAAMWTETADSFVDIHPTALGAGRSYVSSASEGLQVGTVYVQDVPNYGMWAGSKESYTPLTTPGDGVRIDYTRYGLLMGTRAAAGSARATLFRLGVAERRDLVQFVPPSYASPAIRDLYIDPATGQMTVVGTARNVAQNRTEAVVWRSGPGPSPEGPGARQPTSNIRHYQR